VAGASLRRLRTGGAIQNCNAGFEAEAPKSVENANLFPSVRISFANGLSFDSVTNGVASQEEMRRQLVARGQAKDD
jgi:hypothetical protein